MLTRYANDDTSRSKDHRVCGEIDFDQVVDLGDGPETVLFLHGLFGTPEHWLDVMERIAADYRVVAPQLPIDPKPGRRQDGMQTIGDLSETVADFVEAMEIDRPVLCGNSLGGLIAIDLCTRDPKFASGLVLAGSAGLFERSPIKGLPMKPSRDFVRSTVNGIVYDKSLVTDDLVDHWYSSMMDRDYVRFVLRVSRATRDRTVEKELKNLDLPTLIIWGRDDAITPPETGEEFGRRIRGSQLEFIPECGHAPSWEQPEEFARLLDRFLPQCFSQ